MEKLKVKHNHKFTDIIKVCMFALFLILPLLMFLPNAFYYGFNEHAKNETPTEVNIQYKYQSNEVNTLNDLQEGKIYFCDKLYLTDDTGDNNFTIYVLSGDLSELDLEDMDNSLFSYNFNNDIPVLMGCNGYSWEVSFFNSTDNQSFLYYNLNLSTNMYDFIFYIESGVNDFIDYYQWCLDDGDITSIPSYTDFNLIESVQVEENKELSITESLYNAWKNTWQTPLLEWTNNNNFNFTINAFTNVFGITQQSYIVNYLTYIFTMIVIYIIYDIVIMLFTKLTHLFTS